MYDIGIPELRVTEKYVSTDGRSIRYDVEAYVRPAQCTNPSCGHEVRPVKHDSKTYQLRDVKAEGKLCFLNLKVQRYQCPDCGYVFPDTFTFFRPRSHMTDRLRSEIVDRCIGGETFRHIANDYGIDPKTVAAVFGEYATAHKGEMTNDYTPVILGIDEAHIDDHYRLVLTDIMEQRLLDIKRDNKYGTVAAYLRTLDKNVCECATMDFASVYAKAVSKVLPNVCIVIDKFHVVQEINRCLDHVRIDIQNYYKDQGINIRRFKHAKRLFLMNWEDLTDSGTDQLQSWFTEFPMLYEAYMCKETFRDIYTVAEDIFDARKMLNSWIDSIPDFERFAPMRKTISSRKEHILNYWHYHWTNAYTESVNNAIKKIEKAGRGYKFSRLRELCLLEINHPKPERFDPKTAEYVPVSKSIPSREEQKTKIRKLYAPKKGPCNASIDTDFNMNIMSFVTQFNFSRESEIGDMSEYLTLYMEVNSDHTRRFEERMKLYYQRIRELNL